MSAALASTTFAFAQVPSTPAAPTAAETERANKAALLQILMTKNTAAATGGVAATAPHVPGGGLSRVGGDAKDPTQARTIGGVSPLENGAAPRPRGEGLSRTTGDEDEMDDLDIQRRMAPGDSGEKTLPAPEAPLRSGTSIPGVVATPAPVAKPSETVVPSTVEKAVRNLPPDVPKGVGATAIGSASLRTGQAIYRESEPIFVTFTGGSGSTSDWMTVVPAGMAEDNWREWVYLNGEPAGTREFKQRLEPGTYEARLYHDWPRGKFQVVARTTFTAR
jgi:hypothetical protein